jgi:hypothetical protein
MEAIFTITPKGGKIIPDNRVDLELFLLENEDIDQVMTFKAVAKISEKQLMFNFLFGPLMDCAVRGFTNLGYEGMDKVKARYKLQAEFCKAEMVGPNGPEIYLEELSKMSKARLLKFVQDVIFFLESEMKQPVPDSSKYKMMKLTGKAFSSVKFKKKEECCGRCIPGLDTCIYDKGQDD